jgi:hypothetical protein
MNGTIMFLAQVESLLKMAIRSLDDKTLCKCYSKDGGQYHSTDPRVAELLTDRDLLIEAQRTVSGVLIRMEKRNGTYRIEKPKPDRQAKSGKDGSCLSLSEELVNDAGESEWAICRRLGPDEEVAIEGTEAASPAEAWEKCAKLLMKAVETAHTAMRPFTW